MAFVAMITNDVIVMETARLRDEVGARRDAGGSSRRNTNKRSGCSDRAVWLRVAVGAWPRALVNTFSDGVSVPLRAVASKVDSADLFLKITAIPTAQLYSRADDVLERRLLGVAVYWRSPERAAGHGAHVLLRHARLRSPVRADLRRLRVRVTSRRGRLLHQCSHKGTRGRNVQIFR